MNSGSYDLTVIVLCALLVYSTSAVSVSRTDRGGDRNSDGNRNSGSNGGGGGSGGGSPPPNNNCDAATQCRDERYRTLDGTCNNLGQGRTLRGSTGQAHRRLLSPKYGSPTGTIRSKAVSGNDLPSTRLVSTTIHQLADTSDSSSRVSNMHMLWGQFLDHDLTFTPQTNATDCCNPDLSLRSESCIPINIPASDPFWSSQGRTCMALKRSSSASSDICGVSTSQREQLNGLSSFIDAGMVYGSTVAEAQSLRSMSQGMLKTSTNQYLPIAEPSHQCGIPTNDADKNCFLAGELRANEWAGLTSLHTLFVREHNRIAQVLYQKISQDNQLSIAEKDEKTYQETRRIIGAMIQVITYKEYLPTLLGQQTMEKYKLSVDSYDYDSSIDPTVTNVFATAAFRIGHTQIPHGTQPKSRSYGNSDPFYNLSLLFNRPSSFRAIGQDDIVRGIAAEPALDNSKYKFSQEIRDKLFADTFGGMGLDLPAVNAQRGRDHGLPPYNDWRDHCGLPRVTSFTSMPDHVTDFPTRFGGLYEHPDDIDLYPAAVTERPISSDAQVGPTFACLLGKQFSDIKNGDRYWFKSKEYVNHFTRSQVDQLRKITLSEIICLNSDSDKVPEKVFELTAVPQMKDCPLDESLRLSSWL